MQELHALPPGDLPPAAVFGRGRLRVRPLLPGDLLRRGGEGRGEGVHPLQTLPGREAGAEAVLGPTQHPLQRLPREGRLLPGGVEVPALLALRPGQREDPALHEDPGRRVPALPPPGDLLPWREIPVSPVLRVPRQPDAGVALHGVRGLRLPPLPAGALLPQRDVPVSEVPLLSTRDGAEPSLHGNLRH